MTVVLVIYSNCFPFPRGRAVVAIPRLALRKSSDHAATAVEVCRGRNPARFLRPVRFLLVQERLLKHLSILLHYFEWRALIRASF